MSKKKIKKSSRIAPIIIGAVIIICCMIPIMIGLFGIGESLNQLFSTKPSTIKERKEMVSIAEQLKKKDVSKFSASKCRNGMQRNDGTFFSGKNITVQPFVLPFCVRLGLLPDS